MLLAVLLLSFFVPVTAKLAQDHPTDLQRLKQSPSECPAGQYLSEDSGSCKPCTDGIDYTSNPNVLPSCLPCRVCKEDKVTKSRCIKTRDTLCECKPGSFEDKDSTEICQTCSNCTDGEDEVIPCTPKANRKCVPKNTQTPQHNLGLIVGLPVSLSVLVVLVLLGAVIWKTKAWESVCLFMRSVFPGCEQNGNAVRFSLLDPQTSRETNDSHHNMEPDRAQSSPPGRRLLVPANGNIPGDALKLIFEYCPNVVPFHSWDRLMRYMGLTDNQIQIVRTETSAPRDVLYQMLMTWRHQTGLEASINHLLGALEAMGERCALEKIEDYAVKSGKFIYLNTTAQVGVVNQETEPRGAL